MAANAVSNRFNTGGAKVSRGNALIETVLLSVFFYTPMLLMVVVLGEFGLARTAAHTAAFHAAWLPEDTTKEDLAAYFLPTIGGGAPTLEFSSSGYRPAPQFTVDGPNAEDPSRDLQAMFFSLAVGELHQTIRMEGGRMVASFIQEGDSVSRYLKAPRVLDPRDLTRVEPGLVNAFEIVIPDSVVTGQEISIIGAADAASPTKFAVAIQRLLNGDVGTGAPWMLDASVSLRCDYESGLLDALDREPATGQEINQIDDVLTVRIETLETAAGPLSEIESASVVAGGYVRCPLGNRVSDYLLEDLESAAPELFTWTTEGGGIVTLSGFGSSGSAGNLGVENFSLPGGPRVGAAGGGGR